MSWTVLRMMARQAICTARPSQCPMLRRGFSIVSVHSTFPATLHTTQPSLKPKLDTRSRPGDEDQDERGVRLAKDGLIYPCIERGIQSLFLDKNVHTVIDR